jgi:hypothetical protein
MEGMSHHWTFPLVPSLTDRWRGSQAGETSASVSRVQPMQAISLRALTLSSITAFKVGGDDLLGLVSRFLWKHYSRIHQIFKTA